MATKRSVLNSTEVQSPAPADRDFDTIEAPPQLDLVPAPSGGAGDSKLYDALAFAEEQIEVMLHESTDTNAENPVFTACNGVNQYFYRGVPQRVKRKYVAILASCKEHNIKTQEYTQPDGARAIRVVRTSSLKYPFSVISDPAGKKGADWLRSLLQAAT